VLEYDVRGFASAADGSKLFYGIRGHGPALALLDGIGCDGWAWNHIQPHLSADHRTLHVHYRGHGRSGPSLDPDATDVGTLSDDVLRVMDTAAVDSAVLIGHSMGTQVAFEIYRRASRRVRGFVLICGSYGRITHTFHGNDWLHRALPTLIEQVNKHKGVASALWGRLPPQFAFKVAGWIGEIDGPALSVDDFRQYVEHLSDIDLDLYLTMLQKAGDHSAEDLLPDIRVPTLVIAAERDTFTPVDIVRELAELIPGADYVELAGASHAAPLERADAINHQIDAFLERIGGY
jgi:pimeloyl-ACP methyl ester carboxylesterase